MRKAFLDHLRSLEALLGTPKLSRAYLNHSILSNQMSALLAKDHMQRCISVRRLVLAELTLRIVQHARRSLDDAHYVNEVSGGTFFFSLELLKEPKARVPEDFGKNPFGPFWIWLATHFVVIQSVGFSGPAELEVGVLFNLRYKRLCSTIVGYPKSTAPYYYGFHVNRPLIRFADIWYQGSSFPCGSLPKGRLVDAELSSSVFDSEV